MTTITTTYDPEKWKMVPVDPTDSIFEGLGGRPVWPGFEMFKTYWSRAIAAAPTPPTGKTEAEIKAEALIEIASHVREVRDDCIKHDIARMIEGFSGLNQLASQYRENKEK